MNEIALGNGVAEAGPKQILLPVDFSPLTDKALEQAQRIARQSGGRLTVVHVMEPVHQPFEELVMSPAMDDLNNVRMEQAGQRTESLKETLLAAGIRAEAIVLVGSPWRRIVDYAKEIGADLIVLPTHGRTGMQHLLMGSTAERVVQHAPCSVLVAR